MRPWEGVIDIPEGTCSGYAVVNHFIPAWKEIKKFTSRSMFLGHNKPSKPLVFDHESRWHKLTGPTGTWMTDLPVEQYQHDCALKKVRRGIVLVGGLGIGYAATVLTTLCVHSCFLVFNRGSSQYN